MQFHYSNMENTWHSLNSKVEKVSKEKEESKCTIYRVHRHLRTVNDGAYEPEVIAIGPYHRDNAHLKMMENRKWRNLESLVERRGKKADVYARAVSGEESSFKARKCYADHQDFKLTDDEFTEMLVLDGCFIVELVRKYADPCLGKKKGDDPILRMKWMLTSLRRDLMLFENQIPFFVLRNLFDLIKDPNETRTLLQLLTNFFSKLYPAGKGHSGEVLLQVDDKHEIKHLLDLIHHNWVLPRIQQLNSKKKDEKRQKPNPFRTMCCMPVKERKYKEVMMDRGMLLQEGKENEVVISSMPLQERKENEDMTGSMPLQKRKENEVVFGSMPLQDMKGNKVVIGSMSVQEMKEEEIVTIGQLAIDGSSMQVLARKEKKKVHGGHVLIKRNDTDQLATEIDTSSMPVLARNKIKNFSTMCCMPLCLQERKELERNETDVEMGSGTPLQDEENENENEVEMGSEIFINHATELQQLNSKKKDEECHCFRWMCCKTDVESGNEEINHATELTEANVEFKKKEKPETLFDVHFEDGAMVMPPLLIQDGTECFLRNLIVYEQYFQQELSRTVVTDYMMLLDNLIDSAKDVEILSRKGIITNWQGDNEVVAKMVNKLGDLVICGGRNFSYATEFKQVNKHCKKPWNKWMAKLRRDYLNSPWAIISIIAAVVLLLLTVTQTLLSILQVVQEN